MLWGRNVVDGRTVRLWGRPCRGSCLQRGRAGGLSRSGLEHSGREEGEATKEEARSKPRPATPRLFCTPKFCHCLCATWPPRDGRCLTPRGITSAPERPYSPISGRQNNQRSQGQIDRPGHLARSGALSRNLFRRGSRSLSATDDMYMACVCHLVSTQIHSSSTADI